MRATIVVCIIVVGAVALLGGCSGAGAPATELRGGAVNTLAVDNLSAFAVVSSWVALLYPPPTPNTATFQEEHLTIDGQDVLRRWGTLSDGGTFESFVYPDGSSNDTLRWGDGRVVQHTKGPPATVNKIFTQSGQTTYPDGAVVRWSYVANFAIVGTPQTWSGTAVARGGQQMTYGLRRHALHTDRLTVTLPDGTAVNLEAPLTVRLGAVYWPKFAEGVSGSLLKDGVEIARLRLTGVGEQWNRWAIEAVDGSSGTFTLDGQMQGTGVFRRDGEVQAGLRWDANIEGTLDLLGDQQTQVWPSAAARDFQLNRWVSNLAVLGPNPVY